MKFQHFFSPLCVVLLCLCSCTTTGNKQDNANENPVDPVKPLPDTTFSSIDTLEWEVEVYDSIHDGTLSSLEDAFANTPGQFTFRGNMYREASFDGKVTGTPSRIVRDWTFETEEDFTKTIIGTWGGGFGWTGQPLYVHWPDSVAKRFGAEAELTADFAAEEIIAASLYGDLYFVNFATGKASRKSLPLGNPVKGTPSLDPSLNGNIYVGQGIPRTQPVGQTAFNLFTRQCIFPARVDKDSWRRWPCSDSSPALAGGFVFFPSENGTIYKYYIAPDGNLSLHSGLRYRIKGIKNAPGVESSMCIYRNYGFFGDNQGNVMCINLNTMKPIWRYDNHDDIDGTLVLELDGDTPYLYATCEVDLQGNTGFCHVVKLNALDGSCIWDHEINCKKLNINDRHFDGGVYSTPLLGKGNCKGRIFMSVCQIDEGSKAHFIAIDTKTGNEIYRIPLQHFAWSSPVAFYNEKDELFIFTGDSAGNAYLFNGATGDIIFTEKMANNFESSAVVIGNSFVIGSRGKQLYRFTIQ